MKKLFITLTMAFAVLFSAHAVTATDVAGQFSGTLTIGEDPQSGNITILPGSASDKITLVLPQFSFSGINLGDIVVVNVSLASNGALSMTGFPVYISVLSERAFVNIHEGSTISANSVSLDLGIEVPSLGEGELPVLFSGSRVSAGNYQMPNAGFESGWHSVGSGVEPSNWHSFNSGTGSLIAAAKNNTQLTESSSVRPGSTGSKSALIQSKYTGLGFIKVKANGNLTNGQINASSASAANASGNYNFSDPTNNGYNTPFTAQPDSFVFWAKYIPADGNVSSADNKARMHTVITTYARYQDPEADSYGSVKVAEATNNYRATSSKGWQRISTPFVYNSSVNADNAAYILVTFSTNETAGGGTSSSSAVDKIYLDDVEMIYNHDLTAFILDGENITFSNGQATTEKVFSDQQYTYSATVSGRRSSSFVGFDANSNKMLVYTVAEDFVANNKDYKLYTINMTAPEPTAIDEVREQAPQAQKIIVGGRVYIRKGDAWYNAMGMKVQRPF